MGADVVIPTGRHVLLDVDPPELGSIVIEEGGTLECSDIDFTLELKHIVVAGTFQIGSEAPNQYTSKATITLNGDPATDNYGMLGTRGIMVRGGTLELHGVSPADYRTRLDGNHYAEGGGTKLPLEGTAGWSLGDKVVLSRTDFYVDTPLEPHADVLEVIGVNGTLVTVDSLLSEARYAQKQYFDGTGLSTVPTSSPLASHPSLDPSVLPITLDERAFVGHLTRNIVIESADDDLWNDSGIGAHVMVRRVDDTGGTMGVAHVEGVEFRRVGQRNVLGRYPFHWHMLSYTTANLHVSPIVPATLLDDAAGQYVRGCSIFDSENRGVVIHGTNKVEVHDNVLYGIRGHGIFTEDASERGNDIRGNLVLNVRNTFAEAGASVLKLHEAGQSETSGRGSSGFWISNPDNILVDNVAGDCSSNGFWLSFPARTFGLSTDAPIDVLNSANEPVQVPMRPFWISFGEFAENVAFGNKFEGVNLDWVEVAQNGDVKQQMNSSTLLAINADLMSLGLPVMGFLEQATDYGPRVGDYGTTEREKFCMTGCKLWKNAFHGVWNRSYGLTVSGCVSADNCGRYFAGDTTGDIFESNLLIGDSGNQGLMRPDFHGEVTPAAFATYHSTIDIKKNLILDFPAVSDTPSGAFATEDYYFRPVEKGHARNTGNVILGSHPGVLVDADSPSAALAGAIWDPHNTWGPGGSNWYVVRPDPFLVPAILIIPGSFPTAHGVRVAGPYYGFNEFRINLEAQIHSTPYTPEGLYYQDLYELHVDRLQSMRKVLGSWHVEAPNGIPSGSPGSNQGDIVPWMRHFATHPSSEYSCTFPDVSEVIYDIGMRVTGMLTENDSQVISFPLDSALEVDEIFTSSLENYYLPDGDPSHPTRYSYTKVDRVTFENSSPGDRVYWEQVPVNRVWIRVCGEGTQPASSAPIEDQTDAELYEEFGLRLRFKNR